MTLAFDPIANAPENLCKFNATSVGAGNFVVASAYDADHLTPSQANAIDGKVYTYFAQSADGTQWEKGSGVWTLSTTTLARTSIIANSVGTAAVVSFLTVPIVDVFPPAPNLELGIPSGTLMLFQQSTAPVGWTKQTTHDDKALRVVSGAASSGGSNSFSSVMAQTVVGNTTLSLAQMPIHAHGNTESGFIEKHNQITDPYTLAPNTGGDTADVVINTASAGSSNAHSHSILMSIAYVDLIICQKS